MPHSEFELLLGTRHSWVRSRSLLGKAAIKLFRPSLKNSFLLQNVSKFIQFPGEPLTSVHRCPPVRTGPYTIFIQYPAQGRSKCCSLRVTAPPRPQHGVPSWLPSPAMQYPGPLSCRSLSKPLQLPQWKTWCLTFLLGKLKSTFQTSQLQWEDSFVCNTSLLWKVWQTFLSVDLAAQLKNTSHEFFQTSRSNRFKSSRLLVMHLQDTLQHVSLQTTQQASDPWSSKATKHLFTHLLLNMVILVMDSYISKSFHLSQYLLKYTQEHLPQSFTTDISFWYHSHFHQLILLDFQCPQLLNTEERNSLSARHASSISRLLSCVWMVLFLNQTICNWCEPEQKRFVNNSGYVLSKGCLIICWLKFSLPKISTFCWNQKCKPQKTH